MNEKARILVIDDDENIRKALAITLEAKGYVVDTAEDGKEAIEKSNANFYNLALVDIRLPDTEGTNLLTKLKETTPTMVKIIVTGYPSLQNAIEAVNKNADGYIIKPFETEQLISMIETHLKKQNEARRYSEQKVAEYVESRIRELDKSEENQPPPKSDQS
jgi:DNA-binding NtrC family response regulator